VHVVALTELRGPIDAEAPALASDLGVTAYEARLSISGALPAIVHTTVDQGRAEALALRIRGRGHGVVAFDDREVVRNGDMRQVRRFRFDPHAFVTDVPPNLEDSLPYDDVHAIFRAIHKRILETKSEVKEKKFDAARFVASGGLVTSKTSTRQVSQSAEDREQVLYLFRRSGERPWILREGGAQYAGLAADLQPSRAANFLVTLERLKGACRSAVFDERLLNARRPIERSVASAGGSETSFAEGVDLLAHVLSLAVEPQRSNPYRT
jgi:hypothetical protein